MKSVSSFPSSRYTFSQLLSFFVVVLRSRFGLFGVALRDATSSPRDR